MSSESGATKRAVARRTMSRTRLPRPRLLAAERHQAALVDGAIGIFAQPRLGELALGLEDRVDHGREMAVDALEVADDVEMDGARLDRFGPAAAQPREMALGRVLLEQPRRGLLRVEPARQRDVAGREHIEREPHRVLDARVEGADLGEALRRERVALADLLGGQLHQVLVDDVADMLEIG